MPSKPSTLDVAQRLLTGYHFIVSFLLCYLALFQYCRLSFFRDPTSYFFDPERAYAPGYSEHRKAEAATFVEEDLKFPNRRLSSDTPPRLCVGIASVAREGAQYLHYAAGSVLHGLSAGEREEISLIALLAHADSKKHPAAGSAWLQNAADQVLDYSAPFEKQEYVQSIEGVSGKQKEKSLFDYSYLLEACRATGADFVFIMEDDTVTAEGWYPRTMKGLGDIGQSMKVMGKGPTDFLYLRLFYTEKFLGWSSEYSTRYVTTSFLLILLPLLLLAVPYSQRPRSIQRPTTIFIISFLYAPMLILLFFLAGRPSMLAIQPGVHLMPKNACCTQGLVFPSSQVPGVVNWLYTYRQNAESYQDQLIEKYAETTEPNMLRWALTPSVVQHVGDKSSKAGSVAGWGERGPRLRLWSVSFEQEGAASRFGSTYLV